MKANTSRSSTLGWSASSSGQATRGAPTELEKARAETERARADAASAQERSDQLKASLVRSKRDAKVRLRVTAVIMMTAALVRVGWEAAYAPDPVPTPIPTQAVERPITTTPASISKNSDGSIPPDQTPGTLAFERLRTAFHSFPGEDQVALVREINKNDAKGAMTCPLVWTDGVPSLYVGDGAKAVPPYMAASLNRCADAVEKLRVQRDAIAAR